MNFEIRHVGIVVNNLEVSVEFWKNFFSFEVLYDQFEPPFYIDELLNMKVDRLRTVKLKGKNNVLIELLKFDNLTCNEKWNGELSSVGLTHLALTVDNLDELLNRLLSAGYTSLSKILTPPNSKVNVVFVRGPENLMLELVENKIN